MAEDVKPRRGLMLPAFAAFIGAFWSWGAGVLGGAFYIDAAVLIAPVVFASAIALWQRVEEKSCIDLVPLSIAVFIYLMLLGEMTRICPCGFMPERIVTDHFIPLQQYSMVRCSAITVPLAFVALGAMLLPPYNMKTLGYRFAAFVAAFVPFMALSFIEMSIGYRD